MFSPYKQNEYIRLSQVREPKDVGTQELAGSVTDPVGAGRRR